VVTTKPGSRAWMDSGVREAQVTGLARSAGCPWLAPAVEMAMPPGGDWPLYPDSRPFRWTCFPAIGTPAPGVEASKVHEARDFTIATLRWWGVAERCEDVAIVASELLTNALRHALPASAGTAIGWPVQLGLLQPGNCVVCAVADPSRAAPVARQPEYFSETGRGLQVIAALSDRWGYTVPTDMGKVSWAVFVTHLAPPPGPRR
jgi:Histidine kinase-like ATPase domain